MLQPTNAVNSILVSNAGLVLCSPFLPPLFTTLQLLRTGTGGRKAWRDEHSAGRAVHLLQYLVDGRTSAPEASPVLGRLLCGLTLMPSAKSEFVPAPADLEVCDKLLEEMLARWNMVSGSSVGSLRNTFLQREGQLALADGKWTLTVERKTLDVLVDRVPWGFTPIVHSWMRQPISVIW